VTASLPGFANAHSHAFHRLLRGRTQAKGDFWSWREAMYEQAGRLEPAGYEALAYQLYREMLAAGYTAVGEFHYVHHAPGGRPYDPPHQMELALARAAGRAGIRLSLLDTCYLQAGPGRALRPAQTRFGDGAAEGWLERWRSLRSALAEAAGDWPAAWPRPVLGAAIHSLRAVAPPALARIAEGLDGAVPLHIHLSEQPRENAECLAAYGLTPTELLDRAGLLTPRLAVVHATHLTARDIGLLGAAQVTVVACPTTEADLGDGIGPFRALADAGCRLAIGSDQHAVVDPFRELAALEWGQRLALGRRGVFGLDELWQAGGPGGYGALGLGDAPPGDRVEVGPVPGAEPRQLLFAATAADVAETYVGGRRVYSRSGQ
jgi:formiminoglutamate deiminase